MDDYLSPFLEESRVLFYSLIFTYQDNVDDNKDFIYSVVISEFTIFCFLGHFSHFKHICVFAAL